MNIEELAAEISSALQGETRFLVAIAGPPGAGKSTAAERLRDMLSGTGKSAAVIPMDGFHLDNSVLEKRGLLARKGAPQTFDVDGFVAMVRRLKDTRSDTVIPVFDRKQDLSIAGARVIDRETRVLLVEGNYLLIREGEWAGLADLWDTTVFINPGLDELKRRLVQRWLDHGLSETDAHARAMGNDIPNAEYVLANSMPADHQLD